MSLHVTADPFIDYQLYRFGRTRQTFRGPQPSFRGRYVACLGSAHTFGRFAERPYPDLLAGTGVPCANLGTDGAGPGFFLQDTEVLRAASDAEVCIVQAMSAVALSNRMYAVRPRRNGRLHEVSDLMRGIFPEVDFTRFVFVRGMLSHLAELDPNRFRLVENEIKNAWIGRMHSLLSLIETRTILFWFSTRAPEQMGGTAAERCAMRYPDYVDRAMLEAVIPAANSFIECTSRVGLPQDLTRDGEPVLFRATGEPITVNDELPSPEMHAAAAEALRPEVERLLARR